MQWTGLNELREKYLAFFQSKDHLRLPSFSLIPQGDNSLLLIGAGMASTVPFSAKSFCERYEAATKNFVKGARNNV